MASITKTKAVNLVVNKIDKTNFDSMRTAGTITDTMAADELWMGDGRLVSDSDLTAHTGDSNIHTTAAEKAKLSGIAVGANNYTHPSSHPPSIITQDASNRFVTDTEKATWNAKETTAGAQAKVDSHIAVKTNPHGVTKAQVGLGSVNDYSIATQAEAEAGVSDAKYMTPLSTKQAITKAAPVNATTSVSGLMSSTDKSKLDGVATGANNYIHPATDGSLHVPATETTNSGKVLKAGSTAGSLSWGTLAAGDVGAYTKAQVDAVTGILSNLTTTAKTNLVNAVNEVKAGVGANATAIGLKADTSALTTTNNNIGSLSTLATTVKTSVVNAINEVNTKLSNVDVSWAGISGKPSTFTPDTHTHGEYLTKDISGSATNISGQDINLVTSTGFYMGSSLPNMPPVTSGWLYLTVIKHNDLWVHQEVVDLHNPNKTWTRSMLNGSWSAWTSTSIIMSTADPSGGSHGDVWIKYV